VHLTHTYTQVDTRYTLTIDNAGIAAPAVLVSSGSTPMEDRLSLPAVLPVRLVQAQLRIQKLYLYLSLPPNRSTSALKRPAVYPSLIQFIPSQAASFPFDTAYICNYVAGGAAS
jgi:hypothetical protein